VANSRESLRTIGNKDGLAMNTPVDLSPRPPTEPYAYRVLDACAALGISRTSLYELVKRGEIKLIKIAGRTLVPRSELERLTRVDHTA
jgi:excisionase family DNA binding protein